MIKGEEGKKRKVREENNIRDELGGGKRAIKERKFKKVERGRRKKRKTVKKKENIHKIR